MASVAEFHHRLKPRLAEAFLALRALALSLGPDVTERVTDGSVAYFCRDRAFLALQPTKTRLHASFGPAPLSDPNGRLLKRGDERYVLLEGPEAVDAHVMEFVRKAYAALKVAPG